MNTRQAYNSWAAQYDTNSNRTRDLEGQSLRTVLATIPFATCLELGCGTGKNTAWLIEQATHITAVDLSEEMLARAKEKITSDRVQFTQADLTADWTFRTRQYDLVTFSLVLEHIEHLEPVLGEAAQALHPGGHVYIGELHPFKQYSGTTARFDTENGRQVVECFTHHVSDFIRAAKKHGFALVDVDEYFDHTDRSDIPRILTILLKSQQ